MPIVLLSPDSRDRVDSIDSGYQVIRPADVAVLIDFAGLENVVSSPRQCLEWSEQAFALSTTLGLQRDLVYALQYRGFGGCSLNDLGGLEDLREALRPGLEVGAGMATAVAYVNLGWDLAWVEVPQRGNAHYTEAITCCVGHRLERIASVLRMQSLRGTDLRARAVQKHSLISLALVSLSSRTLHTSAESQPR
jgi:hypothetical protein